MNDLNNNEIKKSLMKIEPDSAAQKRIFRAIVARADLGAESTVNRRKDNYMKKNMFWLTASLAACIIIAVSVTFLPNLLNPDNTIDISGAQTEQEDPRIGEEIIIREKTPGDYTPEMLIEYITLYGENNDMVGWVLIEGTDIHSAVMQTDDNEFYLNHDFQKEPNRAGQIFADYANNFEPGKLSDNTILYGHNLTSGDYFSSLTGYLTGFNFYNQNRIIRFDTLYEKMQWEVFAVVLVAVTDENDTYEGEKVLTDINEWRKTDFPDEAAFNEYLGLIMSNTLLETGTSVNYGDLLLTLSTSYFPEGAGIEQKLMVFARLIYN